MFESREARATFFALQPGWSIHSGASFETTFGLGPVFVIWEPGTYRRYTRAGGLALSAGLRDQMTTSVGLELQLKYIHVVGQFMSEFRNHVLGTVGFAFALKR